MSLNGGMATKKKISIITTSTAVSVTAVVAIAHVAVNHGMKDDLSAMLSHSQDAAQLCTEDVHCLMSDGQTSETEDQPVDQAVVVGGLHASAMTECGQMSIGCVGMETSTCIGIVVAAQSVVTDSMIGEIVVAGVKSMENYSHSAQVDDVGTQVLVDIIVTACGSHSAGRIWPQTYYLRVQLGVGATPHVRPLDFVVK